MEESFIHLTSMLHLGLTESECDVRWEYVGEMLKPADANEAAHE